MAVGLNNISGSIGAGAAARPAAASASTTPFPSQCLGEFLRRLEKVDPHPAVLDLGILCGDNIAFLGARGCRVSVESHPTPNPSAAPPAAPSGPPSTSVGPAVPKSAAAAAAASGTPAQPPASILQYAPQSFAGVLAWDAIARMMPADAIGFVEGIRQLLLEGGGLLAHFPPVTTSSAATRFRIVSADLISVEPSNRRCAPPQNFQNREIYALFSSWEIVRVAQLKWGAREVLAVRTRRNGKG